jgi:hypothetical protein
MARLINARAGSPGRSLSLEKVHPNCVEVFYIPEDEKIARAKHLGSDLTEYRVKILLISGQDHFITIYPTAVS